MPAAVASAAVRRFQVVACRQIRAFVLEELIDHFLVRIIAQPGRPNKFAVACSVAKIGVLRARIAADRCK